MLVRVKQLTVKERQGKVTTMNILGFITVAAEFSCRCTCPG
jgi:hypothetical protein